MPQPSRLALAGLSKTFLGQRALDDVHLDVGPGEIHALLGQNGSGKSTVIKILAGYHQPDGGGVASFDGNPLTLGHAGAAHAAGIRFIHQDLALIPDLSVLDNLALGGRYRSGLWISDRREAASARDLLEEWGVPVDPRVPLRELGQAARTMVAIVRAVRDGVHADGLLVLDEPSASLPNHEVEQVFTLVRQLREHGTSVLYVTHRLSEVFELADNVTVLREGRVTGRRPVAGMSHDDLVRMIIGRSIDEFYPAILAASNDPILTVEDVGGGSVQTLSLQLRKGEILGIAGLTGSGRESVANLLFGLTERTCGKVLINGREVGSGNPAAAIGRGLALLPADRKGLGSLPELTVRENVTLPAIHAGRSRWLSLRVERRDVRAWLRRLAVVPDDPERPLRALSGGNQQRALITRWLRCKSKVFLMDEPTQGVDVSAKVQIYQAIRDAAKDGAGFLVASTDNDELAAICDRVIVMRDGAVAITLEGDYLSSDAILKHSMERAVLAGDAR